MSDYICVRGALAHTAKALENGHITVGFVGGSITERADFKRWSDKFLDLLTEKYPGLLINEENAAKGATGCISAIFRAEEDILRYDCDIIFIETSVNDGEPAFGPCREGLLRKLLKKGRSDLVLVYTYCQGFYEDTLAGQSPASVADWEKLARHYGISSADCGRYAFDKVMAGGMRWEEWLPDGLHPEYAGSRVYAEIVLELVEKAIREKSCVAKDIPAPLYPDNWENAVMIDLNDVTRSGPWRLLHERRVPTAEYILYTNSMRSALEFDFEGSGLFLRTLITKYGAGFRWRIDEGEWKEKIDPQPDWLGECKDWITELLLERNLPYGKHHIRLEPCFLPGSGGTSFELCMIGIIR